MQKDQFLIKIHGLRGISILLVLFFHFYESVFRGGYLGVDIFFIISGFIVTKSTIKYWPDSPQGILPFLKKFYTNRISRLLPTGILISVISLLLGLVFTSQNEADSLIGFFRSSLLGYSNILLYLTQGNYFSLSQEFNFFTQTWSLGVEEQFYVIFSLCVCLIPFLKKHFIKVFILITIFSFASNFAFARFNSHEAHFYLIPFRLWEMGIGVLLFLRQQSVKSILSRYRKVFDVYAILALVAAFFIKYSPNSFPFPILLIIYPAVIYIIAFSDSENTSWLDSILKFRFFSFLGTISYSLYLIHWPVLVFIKYGFGKNFVAMTIGLITSIVAAHFITKLVEQPLNLILRRKNSFAIYLLVLSVIVAWAAKGFRQFNPVYIAEGVDTEKMQWKQDFKGCIETSYDIEARKKKCFNPPRTQPHRIYSAGDSHAGQMAVMLKKFSELHQFDVLLMHSGDKANSIQSVDAKDWKTQPLVFEEMLHNSKSGDMIVLTFASYHFDKIKENHFQKAIKVWDHYLKAYIEKGIEVYLVIDSPYYPNYPKESCFFDLKFKSQTRCEISRDEYLKQRANQERFFKELYALNPSLHVWDMIDTFCEEKCSSIENGKLMYFDYNHLSRERAEALTESFNNFYKSLGH